MKFIAIMAVIVGHYTHDWRSTFIYAWHMPLFFMVSGYLFSPSSFRENISRNAKRYLSPYAIVSIVIILIEIISTGNPPSLNTSIPLLTGGTAIWGYTGGAAIWFLMTLFLCSVGYNILYSSTSIRQHITSIILALCCIGYILNHYFKHTIPFTIPQTLIAILFFHVGYCFKKYGSITPRSHSWLWWVLSIIFFTWSFRCGRLDMYFCIYPFLPINILGAIGGTFIILQICHYFASYISAKITRPIAWLGAISILIFIAHTIEYSYDFSTKTGVIIGITDGTQQYLISKILFALIVSLLLYQIPIVRKVFRLSKPQYIDLNTSNQ